MSKIKIVMDSGKEYIIESNIKAFLSMMKNSFGVLMNVFITVSDGISINPSHVSSIEEINE